jgi:hypothetical protein
VALGAVAFAFAFLAQGNGPNQGSHYALTVALVHGTPQLDRTRLEVGGETNDLGVRHGHYYSDKAPGLAASLVPAYLALHAVGLGDRAEGMLWVLTVLGAALPAFGVVLLVRRVVDRLVPGTGLAAAVTLALGTLLLPFATLLFSHALAALLAFAPFALLLAERSGPPSTRRVALAGLLAGLGVVVEYPNAIVVAILLVYAARRSLRRAAAYAAGAVVGVLPLAAYDWWAFGSPFRYSRSHALLVLKANRSQVGVGGVGLPHPVTAVKLLVEPHLGLLTGAPVLVMAAVGLVLLWRRYRAEVAVAGSICIAFFVMNAGFIVPFGGATPGPRYLVPALPFLALGLGPAFARFPRTTVVLAALSIARNAVVTACFPLSTNDGHELRRFVDRAFVRTVLDAFNLWTYPHPVAKIVPFFAAVAIAAAAALVPAWRRKTA